MRQPPCLVALSVRLSVCPACPVGAHRGAHGGSGVGRRRVLSGGFTACAGADRRTDGQTDTHAFGAVTGARISAGGRKPAGGGQRKKVRRR